MRDVRAIADRVEIEALRGESIDAQMMDDYDRVRPCLRPQFRAPGRRLARDSEKGRGVTRPTGGVSDVLNGFTTSARELG